MWPADRLRSLRKHYGLRRGLIRECRIQRDRLLRRVTGEALLDDLRRLGVQPGDILFVHTALSPIGHVVGGTGTVIEALMRAVGARGTVLMPAFPCGGLVLDYARRGPVFDVAATPCDLGVIPETFRVSVATQRSLHPTHSVSAWGARAAELTEGHERAVGPFGPGTPFVRCLEAGGRGLIIGARVHNYTTLRAIEDTRPDYPLPIYWPERFELEVIDRQRRRMVVSTKVHNPLLGPYRNGDLLVPYLKAAGVLREGLVGFGPGYLVEGSRLLGVLDRLVDQGVLAFTITPEEYLRRHGRPAGRGA